MHETSYKHKEECTGYEMSNIKAINALIVFVLITTIISLYVAFPYQSQTSELVVATLPSLAEDVKQLVNGCGVDVVSLVPPGIDPHHYNLDTRSVSILMNALAVVSSGHAPFEIQIRDLGLGDKLIEIPEIRNIKYATLPSDGVNVHMPIYDPTNYKEFLRGTAGKLSELIPSCRDLINTNLDNMLEEINQLSTCNSYFNNSIGVAASPFAQYAVSWLGIDVKLILTTGEETSINPQRLEMAKTLLEKGAIAIIAINDKGEPVDKANEWLLDQANEMDAKIIYVYDPSIPTSTLEKISFICNELSG